MVIGKRRYTLQKWNERKETVVPMGLYREGGGGRYVPPQRVWFLSHFGPKTGIDFEYYGLKLGIVFKGTTSREHINIFVFSTLNWNNDKREVTKIYHLS